MTRIAECSLVIEAVSAEHAARDTLARMAAQLAAWDVPDAVAGQVQIAVAEVLNNVVEHAYGWRDGEPFTLRLTQRAGRLTCRVTDQGRPFPGLVLPEGCPANLDLPRDQLPEGGFGWFMIRALTERLTYERRGDSNILTLVFPLG